MEFKVKVKFNSLYNYQISERVLSEEDFDFNIRVLNRMLESGEIKSYEVFHKTETTADDFLVNLMDKHTKELKGVIPCIN
jgi:hypothetical protein